MVKLRIAFPLCLALIPASGIAQSQGSATVSGIVTDAVTHLPIQGANVSIGGSGIPTDESGSYSVSVKPGAARIRVSRIGYLTNGAEIEIHEGDSLRRDLEVRPSPRIAGAIIDADTGQPMKGCLVFATRRITALGEYWYASAGIPTADSRYGTFETVGLEPGEYVLEVTGCAWAWYPGVSRLESATPITVSDAGIQGLNIKLSRRDNRRVSGIAEHGAVDVRLVRHMQDVAQTLAQVRADAAGRFAFPSVPTGEFHLVTSAGAHEVIEVTDHDLTDISLKAQPSVRPQFAIRMLEDGVSVPATAQPELVPIFDREPGPQWPRLNGLPPGYAVSAIETSGPQITLIVTSKTGRYTGKTEATPAVAIAIREPYGEYLDQSMLPRTRVDKGASYTFENLAPGKYKMVTLTGDEALLERNEAFLRKKASTVESAEVVSLK